MISSVIPWQKYSWSLPGLISTKGRTAIEDERPGSLDGSRRGVRRRSHRDIHGSQIPKELARRAIAPIGIFLERFVDDGLERSRQRGVQREKRRLQPVQEMIEDRRGGIALKRRSPGRHLEQHDSQCKQVRARIEPSSRGPVPATCNLPFQQHVRTLLSSPDVVGPSGSWVENRLEELRHTEVENLDALVIGNHHVARLQIPVHDSCGVSTREAVSHLSGEGDRLREWKAGAGHSGADAGCDPERVPS